MGKRVSREVLTCGSPEALWALGYWSKDGDCWIGPPADGQGYTRYYRDVAKALLPVPRGLESVPLRSLQVDHICRNRSCLNPEHLEWVTPGANIRRKVAAEKGKRITRGSYEPGRF